MTSTLERPAAGSPAAARARPRRWQRPALLALLVVTAVLYLCGLGRSGWANSFYSAAAQAGSASWKAFFYGSSDAASSITVDKTPASLWVMAPVRTDLRAVQREHPGAAGADGRRLGRPAVRDRHAVVRPWRSRSR